MNKIARIEQILAFSLLFLHSSTVASQSSQADSIDKNKSLRIIGIVAAIGGIIILSRQKGSTFLGLVLLIAGTVTTIEAEKIIKKSPKFFKLAYKAVNNTYLSLQEYFFNEPEPEQQSPTCN